MHTVYFVAIIIAIFSKQSWACPQGFFESRLNPFKCLIQSSKTCDGYFLISAQGAEGKCSEVEPLYQQEWGKNYSCRLTNDDDNSKLYLCEPYECDDGFYKDQETKTCKRYNECKYFINKDNGKLCIYRCEITQYKMKYFENNEYKYSFCSDQCYDGFYKDEKTMYCERFVDCKKVLFNKQCIDKCPNGYGKVQSVKDVIGNQCMKCSDTKDYAGNQLYEHDGECKSSCPVNFFVDKEFRCNHVQTCLGVIWSDSFSCIKYCPIGYGKEYFCQYNTCYSRCKACPKIYQNYCVSECPPPSNYIAEKQLCLECESGYSYDSKLEMCLKDICSVGSVYSQTDKKCIACLADQAKQGKCQLCPNYSVFSLSKQKCMQCPIGGIFSEQTQRCEECQSYEYDLRKCQMCRRDQFYSLPNERCEWCPLNNYACGKSSDLQKDSNNDSLHNFGITEKKALEEEENDSSSNISKSIIIGIVFGVVALIGILVFVVLFIQRRNKESLLRRQAIPSIQSSSERLGSVVEVKNEVQIKVEC